MPTIWEDKYLKNHTRKQLDALEESYEEAKWQCPRCDTVNPVWSRIRIIAGNYDRYGLKYEINYFCYNSDCNFKRSSNKEYNLNGFRPRNKDRKKPQEYTYLEYKDRMGNSKWWQIELYTYGGSVVTRNGKSDTRRNNAAFQQHFFKTVKEAESFYENQIAEKIGKGYFDPSVKAFKKKVAAKRKR